jgi:hypothetical protein
MRIRQAISLAVVATAALAVGELRSPAAPTEALHTTPVWTTVASACTPDEDSLGRYDSQNSNLSHRGGAVGGIAARCNIVNLTAFGAGDHQVLEVVYRDQDGPGVSYHVQAFLKFVKNVDGSNPTIVVFDSNLFPASSATQTRRVLFAHHFNFTPNAYYVTLIIERTNTAQTPLVSTVRLRRIP